MLAYGDPRFRVRLDAFARELGACAVQAGGDSLTQARVVLIQAGQLEQGLADLAQRDSPCSQPSQLEVAQGVTDAAAEHFLEILNGHAGSGNRHLRVATAGLKALETVDEACLEIKVPEGFEFYTLYPEQYRIAVDRLVGAAGGGARRALVVGIRSIGTSLSALVAAELRRRGWEARRLTVRPSGHPFERVAHLPSCAVGPDEIGIVVDEGPGLSGSSMAAVERVLRRLGCQRIAFLPGHAGMPGSAGNAEVAACWQRTSRYCATHEDLRWNGQSLREILIQRSARLLGLEPGQVHWVDAGCGGWRPLVYQERGEWPGVAGAFERTKYLCLGRNGRGLLWKFDGLGSAKASSPPRNQERVEESGGVVRRLPVVARTHGFAATQWMSGDRFRRGQQLPHGVLVQIGTYVRSAAGSPLNHLEHEEAVCRLNHMLLTNAAELLGEGPAKALCGLSSAAMVAEGLPSYTDGRMGPHEFVVVGNVLLKADWSGHACDHTVVGRQSLLWDVAGMLVEWDVRDPHAVAAFLTQAELPKQGDALLFYIAAYAAFRLGMCAIARGTDSDENARLERDRTYYEGVLRRTLAMVQEPATAT